MNEDRRQRERRRLCAWALHQQGWTGSAIANELGVSRAAVSQWLREARARGPDALRSSEASGRPPKLTAAQRDKLRAIYDAGPSGYGLNDRAWKQATLRTVLQEEFGVAYKSGSHISQIVRSIGRSLRDQSGIGRQPGPPLTLAVSASALPVADLLQSGRELAVRDDWMRALTQGFIPALMQLPDGDDKLRLLPEIAQTYTNAGALDLSDRLLDWADALATTTGGDPGVAAAIASIRGWNAGLRGRFDPALAAFAATRTLARTAGDSGRESTGFHFAGRLALEQHMPQLFPDLAARAEGAVAASAALAALDASQDRKRGQGELALAYDFLWAANAHLLQNDTYQARRLLGRSLAIFEEARLHASAADVRVELVRLNLLKSTGHKRELESFLGDLDGILRDMQHSQYPRLIADALVLRAYTTWLLSSRNDRACPAAFDDCEAVLRIYPFPKHPLSAVALGLQRRFASLVEARVYNAHQVELADAAAVANRSQHPVFRWLDNFLLSHPEYRAHEQVVEGLLPSPPNHAQA